MKLLLLSVLFLSSYTLTYASPNKLERSKWTILVYLNGDNNLDSAGDDDINEMESVGSTDDIKIIVEQDKLGDTGTIRYLIERDDDPKRINSKILSKLPEVDMGAVDSLVDFAGWGIQNYPAEYYLVIIWNHGSGWRLSDATSIKGVSYDDTDRNHLNPADLSTAFSRIKEINNGRAIDIIGFDACLMAAAEIMEQLFGLSEYVISSEEVEPFDGWPYDDFLSHLSKNPEMLPKELGSLIVEKYGASYSGGSQGFHDVTLSLVDLALFPSFREILNSFTLSLIKYNEFRLNTVFDSARESQRFYFPYFRDIMDFSLNISEGMSDIPEVLSWAKILASAIDTIVISNFATPQKSKNSHGISLYIPHDKRLYDMHKKEYAELYWSKRTNWLTLLDSMHYPTFPILRIKDAIIKDDDDRIVRGDTLTSGFIIENVGGDAESVSLILETKSPSMEVENLPHPFPIVKNGSFNINDVIIKISENAEIGEEILLDLILKYKDTVIDKRKFIFTVNKPLKYFDTLMTTPHPYPPYYSRTWTIMEKGARSIALHFKEFDMELNRDFTHIYDYTGKKLATYTGKLGNFWTSDFEVDYLRIVVTTDYLGSGNGFYIDKYGIISDQ